MLVLAVKQFVMHSCSDCVNREIEGNLNFHCPKCNRLIQKSDLREETREVFETKKIREARERALKILRKLFDDYDSDEAKKYTQQRDVLCTLCILCFI